MCFEITFPMLPRYVLTRRVEKIVPLRRLTTIVMPHRGPMASLRQAKLPATVVVNSPSVKDATEFRKMSTIQMLKYGFNNNLWEKKDGSVNCLRALE